MSKFYKNSRQKYFTILTLLCIVCQLSASENKASKRILLLNTQGQTIPAINLFIKGYKDKMAIENMETQYMYEYMDLYRYTGDEKKFYEAIKNYYKIKYQDRNPDVIVGLTHGASAFLVEYGEELFSNTPVLLAELEDVKKNNIKDNIYVVLDTLDVHKMFSLIPRLHPDVKKIYVIIGNSLSEKRFLEVIKNGLNNFNSQVEVVFTNEKSLSEIIDIAQVKEKQAVLYYLYLFQDGKGVNYVPAKALELISQNTKMPIYNMMNHTLYDNVIGGYLQSFEVLGYEAAKKSIEILNNTGGVIRQFEKVSSYSYMFNWQALQKFNIDENFLPEGATIINEEYTFWQLYRNYIVIGFVVLIFQSLLIIALLRNILSRKNIEKKILIINKNLEHRVEEQVTEIKGHNQQLIDTNKTIVLLQDFKENMMNMIIHDIKTPLNTIINAQYLSTSNNELGLVQQAGFKILHLVENVLDVYKYESAEFKLDLTTLGLKNIISSSLSDFVFLIQQKSLSIRVIGEERICVRADKDILRRVLINLLSNAVKFSPEGGEISVNYFIYQEGMLKVEVVNEGPSISKENQREIFIRYNQEVKQAIGKINSTGLGLAFCKLAIEAHGGEIGVTSEPNSDVRFWFTLPFGSIGTNTTEELIVESIDFQLSDKDMLFLSNFTKHLILLNTYEVSAINKILHTIIPPNKQVQRWKEQVELAVFNGNNDAYIEIINFR